MVGDSRGGKRFSCRGVGARGEFLGVVGSSESKERVNVRFVDVKRMNARCC